MSTLKKALQFFSAILLLFSSDHISFASQIEVEDNCISIIVTNSERMNSLPDDFNSSSTPAAGNDFFILEMTISKIKCGYVFPDLNDMKDNTYVFDMDSNKFVSLTIFAQGIQFEDPSSLASNAAFVDGSLIIIAFELPIQSQPSSIQFAYFYGPEWNDADDPIPATLNFNLMESIPDGTIDSGYNITSSLWAKATLQVPGNPVNLVWKGVGSDTTPSGDKVISGYYYADPKDFAYGSVYNPEVFVKVYIAGNGWANIAFNHVTVDDVTISSAHNYNGAADMTGSVTLNDRLEEHQYNGVSLQ